jgi:hypothetical protein
MLQKHYQEVLAHHAKVQTPAVRVAIAVWAALAVFYYWMGSATYAAIFSAITLLLVAKAWETEHSHVEVRRRPTSDAQTDEIELSLDQRSCFNRQLLMPVSVPTMLVMLPHIVKALVSRRSYGSHTISHAFSSRELLAVSKGRLRVEAISDLPLSSHRLPSPCVVIIEHLQPAYGKNFLEILSSFGLTHKPQQQIFVYGSRKMFAHRVVDPVYNGFAMPKDGYDSRDDRDRMHECLHMLAQRKTVCFYPLGWDKSTGYKPGAFVSVIAAGVPLVLQRWTHDHDGCLRLTLLIVNPLYGPRQHSVVRRDAETWALHSYVWPLPYRGQTQTYREYRSGIANAAIKLSHLAFAWVHGQESNVHYPL